MVPPVRKPRSCARLKTSATIPWPANAASPWRITASTHSHASLAGVLEKLVEERDDDLASLDRVPALSEVFRPEEALERLRGQELLEDPAPHLARRRLGSRADPLAKPLFLGRVGDEAILDA